MIPNRTARLLVLALLAVGLAVAVPRPASAGGPLYRTTYPSKVTHKLWSGITNVLFCWCEIPIEMNREIQSTDPFTGTFVGLGKGVVYTGRRLGLGVADVVTCPFDVYDNNYQTIQRTEFPFIDEVE